MTTDVVIIGGGPNGLLTACELALAGVRPIVLERLPEPSSAPKANGMVGRVVQALDYRGLISRLGGDSPPRPVPHFQFGALGLHMAGMDGNALYALPVPQRRIEEVLAERACELGVELRRGHELVGIRQRADRVEIEVDGPDGAYRMDARFLVGADGGRSTVRKMSGIDFPGITDRGFASHTGVVAIDVPEGELLDVPGIGRLRQATFTRTETGLFVYLMLSPGHCRIATIEWDAEPEAEDSRQISFDELRASIRRVLGADLPMSVPPEGGWAAKLSGSNSRQAERYRQGRILLVGDAAHVHSALGGPGLNLGLQDALNLGWKLAAEINGWAPEGLLDTYESERHPVGARVLMQSRAQLALIAPGPNVTALRQLMEELLRSQANIRHISDLMAGADTRYDTGAADPHELAGRWMPDLPLQTSEGPTRVAELMRAGRPVLLDLAGTDLGAAAEGWSDRVDVLRATTPEPPADAVLVRPDGHVAWAGADAEQLQESLKHWFG
jgi:2-polyprenyl-6-methoxyphenol hydroxylase-like FAD-dependent oxidoreductase